MRGLLDVAELLVQKSVELNIDLNARDSYGMTVFHIACKKNNFKMVLYYNGFIYKGLR